MEELIANLEKNGFSVITAADRKEALRRARDFVHPGMRVGLGGSETVREVGLLEELAAREDIELYNQYEPGIDMEENLRRRRLGLLSDLYVTGCNAITRKGELVNADGSGNRVAAQIFGPKKVLLLVGRNKIVEDLHAAFRRIREIAAVKNVARMNRKMEEMGKAPRFNLKNIANKFAWIDGDEPGRTTIILIDEDLGY